MAKHLANKTRNYIKMGGLIERFPVINVTPVFEGGRFSAKVVVDEVFPVSAKVFREGHDFVSATALIVDSRGKVLDSRQMTQVGYKDDDDWTALLQAPKKPGEYAFCIEGWSDVYHTWEHTAWIKIPQNIDIELVFEEGARIFDKWSKEPDLTVEYAKVIQNVSNVLRDKTRTPDSRLQEASSEQVHQIWDSAPLREQVSRSDTYLLQVQRSLASFSAWYQFFPRSEGARYDRSKNLIPGTFATASKRLDAVKDMGFDIIYLPPIHPIGVTCRKGKNNTLDAKVTHPGSPWAVGNQDGGHDTVAPELGTLRTFKNFVKKAHDLGLEVSLDLALQCSPDHPWVKQHPEWFNTRPDGTIAYAENPPKKYQDIYPLNFDNDPDGIFEEVLRIVKLWIECGVSVFRVDNPHTKPVWFWQKLIAAIRLEAPEVIWLAEAFTKPAMMKTLGLIGYEQSHSYFLWRNNKYELSQFLSQISGDDAFWYRATLWPTTPDNLTDYLAHGGTAGHAIRAVLAAMGSPTWGIYAGYELVEDRQRQNVDGSFALEHVDSEKYEIKVRDWREVSKYGIADLLKVLNQIRKKHVACQNIHALQIQTTNNDNVIAFSRHIPARFTKDGKDDTLVVVVNLDPHNAQQATVYLDWGALNLPASFKAVDEITSREYRLDRQFYVDLAPVIDVAHIFHIKR